MKIGIVILNFNSQKLTRGCLDSLSKIKSGNFDTLLIAVDNNSSEKFTIQEKEYKNLRIIRSKKNLGFSGGNNLGIRLALEEKCDYILILNNDTVQKEDFVEKLLKAFEDQSIGIASPKIYYLAGHEYHKKRYKKNDLGHVIWYAGGTLDRKNTLMSHRGVDEVDSGQFEKEESTEFASGCCMLVRKEVFEKIGLFDERYFLYLEDLEFSLRAAKKKYGIVYVPGSVVWHINAGSTGGSGSDLQDYFFSRNRLLFGLSYMKFRAKFALFRESLKLLNSGRKMQKLGVRDYYIRNFGKGSMPL